MNDEEFIARAAGILNDHGCVNVICSAKDTLCLGCSSYMRRFQLIGAAKAILQLEGYSIVEEVRKQ